MQLESVCRHTSLIVLKINLSFVGKLSFKALPIETDDRIGCGIFHKWNNLMRVLRVGLCFIFSFGFSCFAFFTFLLFVLMSYSVFRLATGASEAHLLKLAWQNVFSSVWCIIFLSCTIESYCSALSSVCREQW